MTVKHHQVDGINIRFLQVYHSAGTGCIWTVHALLFKCKSSMHIAYLVLGFIV